ncbi:MAG: hypothetical protein SVU88_02795, partial [Candidatus Nanohaloarchaea archaeon]|nr:hypothetical protein [Candidatus Nanohaloarchaea archaeon]
MARSRDSDAVRRFSAVSLLAVLVAASASMGAAAPVQLFNDRVNVDGGNVTAADWINPDGEVADLGGDLDLRGNSLLGFFGSACGSGQAVADVNNDGTFSCVSISG